MNRLEKYEIELIREASGFPPKYRNNIVRILESNERTEDLFVEELHSLASQDQTEFVETLLSLIRTRTVDHYYNVRYTKARQTETSRLRNESPLEFTVRFIDSFPEPLQYLFKKEHELAVAHSPEQQRLLENNPQVFVEYLEPGHFPQTDSWIERKRIELRNLIPQLEEAKKEFTEQFSLNKSNFSISHPENYIHFPASFISDDRTDIDLQSLRIKGFKTFSQLVRHLSIPLESFSRRFGKNEMEAFVYNSFDFSDNKTEPALLELNKNDKVYYYKIHHSIREIAGQAKDHGIQYQEFAKSLFLNYGNHRNLDGNLKKHLKNLSTKLSRIDNTPKK